MAGPSANEPSGSRTAQKSWELANDVQVLDADKVFRYDAEEQKAVQNARPWKSDPRHFKKVRISAVAMIKMVMHARSGGQYEIMGLMQGKIDGDTFVVMDSFALPVQGTETRVNAANEANEYMVEFLERSKDVGRLENAVGWYHSHPGYGCWLSGIDVNTQLTNQTFTDPFVAVVIDPNRTISAGRIDIGAFRTYPAGYSPPSASSSSSSEYQSIPLAKIEDFGAHADSYYQLEVEHFKSSLDARVLDLLWNKYWVMTLSQSPLVSNRAYTTSQISDLVDKLSRTEGATSQRCTLHSLAPLAALAHIRSTRGGSAAASRRGTASGTATSGPGSGPGDESGTYPASPQLASASAGPVGAGAGGSGAGGAGAAKEPEKEATALMKAVRDAEKIDGEGKYGIISQILKDALFNGTDRLALPVA